MEIDWIVGIQIEIVLMLSWTSSIPNLMTGMLKKYLINFIILNFEWRISKSKIQITKSGFDLDDFIGEIRKRENRWICGKNMFDINLLNLVHTFSQSPIPF